MSIDHHALLEGLVHKFVSAAPTQHELTCKLLSAANSVMRLQVAFVKLKIAVTDRQLRRVAEALMRDIHAASKTQPKNIGVDVRENLQQEKMARCGALQHSDTHDGRPAKQHVHPGQILQWQ